LQKLLFIGDPHIPYHSEVGLSIWFAALRDFKPDIVVSTGDFVDCFAVSTYSKDPRRVFHLHGEMEAAGAVLDQINELAPKARRIYLGGNHEDRLQRYLQDKAPELFPFIDIPKLLHLDERGFEYVGYKESTKVGKLNLTHDVGTAGRTAIFKALDAFQSPVVTGHTHRMGYIVEGDATGGTQVSASFGWLGDIAKVDYMHQIRARRDWTLGFGYGYLDASNGYVLSRAGPDREGHRRCRGPPLHRSVRP
jgi:predicted phosphodiesterase